MKRGFGLIEIIIGSAVLSLALWGISSYYEQAVLVSQNTAKIVQASFLLEEGVEVAKLLRDQSFTNVSAPATGTSYYLTFNGTSWATTTTPTLIDGTFDRTIRFDDVYRSTVADATQDDIVTTGGVLDAGTRKVTVTVSWWDRTATTTRSVSTYLMNIF